MTPEQKEVIIKGLLFAASGKSNRLQQIDAIDTAVAFLRALATSPTATVIAPEQGLAEIFEDLWCGYSDTFDPKLRDLLAKGRALLKLAASQPAPTADTGQAVGFLEPEDVEKLRQGESVILYAQDRDKIGVPVYPAPLDAEHVREAIDWDFEPDICEDPEVGCEPSLSKIIHGYYDHHMGKEEADALTPQYIAAFERAALRQKDTAQ